MRVGRDQAGSRREMKSAYAALEIAEVSMEDGTHLAPVVRLLGGAPFSRQPCVIPSRFSWPGFSLPKIWALGGEHDHHRFPGNLWLMVYLQPRAFRGNSLGSGEDGCVTRIRGE